MHRSILHSALLAACLMLGTAAPALAQLRDAVETTLTARDGTAFVVTRGFVRVPQRRSQPNGAAIDLAIVRVSRPGKAQGPASAVLAGGPGDGGVEEVLSLAMQGGAVWADLMGGDVVGMDQRGVGASKPNLASTARYDLPLDKPGSSEAWLPSIAAVSRREAQRVSAMGVDLSAYNTEESADDVEAVRLALGLGKMILWGRSYGSHLALVTLRRHPQGVERVVLVSPEGPDHTWKSPAETDRVLERIAQRAGAPEMIADMRKVTADLGRQPRSVAVRHPVSGETTAVVIGPFDIMLLVAQAGGDPRGLAGMPAAFRRMAAGDYQAIAPLVMATRAQLSVQSAMKQAMDLSSGASPARLARIHAEAPAALLGEAMNFPGMALGEAWGVSPLADSFRAAVTSDAPVLMIVGDLDVRTPIANATEIAANLPNAQIVVVENAAHAFNLFGNAELRAILADFVAGRPVKTQTVTLAPLAFQK